MRSFRLANKIKPRKTYDRNFSRTDLVPFIVRPCLLRTHVSPLHLDLQRYLALGCPMEPQISASKTWRRAAAWLMLVAILMRVGVPQGWMPNAQAFTSGAPIVICTSTGQLQIVLDENGNPAPSGEQDDASAQHQPCAFSVLAGLSLPLGSFVLALPTNDTHTSAHYAPDAPTIARRVRPTEARGPPPSTI